MYEIEATQISEFAARLHDLRACLNIDGAKAQIRELETLMTAPGFWNDPDAAQKIGQKLKQLQTVVAAPDALQREIDDAAELLHLAQEESDESLAPDLAGLAQTLHDKLKQLEITSLFTDPRDAKDAILSIHPGAGGTESCDWAEMLYRMILRFCERRDFQVNVVEYQPGDGAGLKSATLTVSGPFAYGNLKSEAGVHRLVRISPFDANRRRHTSFAAIEVLTEVDEDIEIEITEDEIKMDVFRSSGAGGQKVNKTSSAVRLTHLPTGLVVACQIERSQHRNRALAMHLLRAKLYDMELKKKEAEIAAQRDGYQDVAWGSQIRSYVLQPYQLIKDHRTNFETSNVERVLDGEIDAFVENYLRWNLQQKSQN